MRNISLSTLELASVATLGALLSRYLLQREALTQTAVDTLTAVGTYVCTKATFNAAKEIRGLLSSRPTIQNQRTLRARR